MTPVDSPHKDQWREALILYLTHAWTNNWANNLDAGDLKRHRTYYGGISIFLIYIIPTQMLKPGGRLNKKDVLTRYGNSHVKDKTS